MNPFLTVVYRLVTKFRATFKDYDSRMTFFNTIFNLLILKYYYEIYLSH